MRFTEFVNTAICVDKAENQGACSQKQNVHDFCKQGELREHLGQSLHVLSLVFEVEIGIQPLQRRPQPIPEDDVLLGFPPQAGFASGPFVAAVGAFPAELVPEQRDGGA